MRQDGCLLEQSEMPMTTKPTIALKLGAIAFTLLWAGWMMLVSITLDAAGIAILTVCAAAAGYAWYRMMRWSLRRLSVLPEGGEAVPGEPS
jgi:hypothetical protein